MDNMMRIKFQSYTIILYALEIIVDFFNMGTWGNKVTKVFALPPTPLPHPCRSSQNTKLSSLCYMTTSH